MHLVEKAHMFLAMRGFNLHKAGRFEHEMVMRWSKTYLKEVVELGSVVVDGDFGTEQLW